MTKQNMAFVLFLFFALLAKGQENLLESGQSQVTPRFSIKNGTSSLFDPVIPSFNVGFEKYFDNKLSIYLEGGPSLPYRYFTSYPDFNSLWGYRLRLALRYYFTPPQMDDVFYYVELYGSYYQINANIEGDFSRNTDFGFYRQRFNYDADRNRIGTYVNFGFQSIETGGFLIELGLGAGVIRREDEFSDVPPDADFITNGSNIMQHTSRDFSPDWSGTIFFYINLGFAFD